MGKILLHWVPKQNFPKEALFNFSCFLNTFYKDFLKLVSLENSGIIFYVYTLKESMKKILIVDDDPDLLFNLRVMLNKRGFMVFTLVDGHDTISMVHTILPDLVVLDVHIGEVDGRIICRELKDDLSTKTIPVLMISSDLQQSNVKEICEADDFLEKPFKIVSLEHKINALVA